MREALDSYSSQHPSVRIEYGFGSAPARLPRAIRLVIFNERFAAV